MLTPPNVPGSLGAESENFKQIAEGKYRAEIELVCGPVFWPVVGSDLIILRLPQNAGNALRFLIRFVAAEDNPRHHDDNGKAADVSSIYENHREIFVDIARSNPEIVRFAADLDRHARMTANLERELSESQFSEHYPMVMKHVAALREEIETLAGKLKRPRGRPLDRARTLISVLAHQHRQNRGQFPRPTHTSGNRVAPDQYSGPFFDLIDMLLRELGIVSHSNEALGKMINQVCKDLMSREKNSPTGT